MKRAFIYTIFLLTAGLFLTELKAQEVYLGEVKIIQNRFEQQGDSVYIEMNVNLNGLPVHKNQAFILTPVVETEKESEELPSIVINGKRREKAYQRALAFNHGHPPFPIYTTVIVNQWSRERIAYNVVIPYETWMKDAKLNLRENFCECGGEKRLISIKMLAQTITLENRKKKTVEVVATEKVEEEKNIYYKEVSSKPNLYTPRFQRKSEGAGQNQGNARFYHEQSRLRDHGNLPHRLRITRGIIRAERGVIQRSHESAEELLAPQVFISGKPLPRGLARGRLDRVEKIDSPVRDAG